MPQPTNAPDGPRDWYHVGPVLALADPDGSDDDKKSKGADVYLYDVIGGWWGLTADDFVRDVAALDVDTIDLHLNTPGGEVSEGVAIANMLRQHRARVRVWVDGMAASSGSVVAMAGDEIIMGIGSQMMVHKPKTWAVGDDEEMDKVVRMLRSTGDAIASTYAAKAGGTVADWQAVMKAETWYTAEEAVKAGLADRVATDEDKGGASGQKVTPGASSGFWDMWDALRSQDRLDLTAYHYQGREQAPAPKISARRRSARGRDVAVPLAKAAEDARELRAIALKTTALDPGADEPKKGAGMSLAQAREVLAGLPDTASDDQVREALASAGLSPTPPTEPPTPDPDPAPRPTAALPPGMRLISDSAWEAQQDRVKRLEAREAKREREERDAVIDKAVRVDGKFTRQQVDHFKSMWDKDPEGTRALIDSLQKNVALPTNEIGYAEGADEENELFAEFESAMPPHLRLKTKGA